MAYMHPDQLTRLQDAVRAVDEQFWNGDPDTVSRALNEAEDAFASIRASWPRED